MSATPAISPEILLDIHTGTLDSMGQRGPQDFHTWAGLVAQDDHPDADLSEETFRAALVASGPGGALTAMWRRRLTDWDFAPTEARWADDTPPRTDARRTRIHDRLGFGYDVRKALDSAVPVHKKSGAVVITDEYTPWYTRERAARTAFYWPKYRGLLEQKGWSAQAVGEVDAATDAIVERLADPEQAAAKRSKGLVVGHVQSGKTANFTGVVAKAVDAGYRLVIVLGGTINLLRSQTQRRLDKELIGQENILGDASPDDPETLIGIDYVGDDDEWDEFVSFGDRPSQLGYFDIDRLTTRDRDYRSLAQGIRALAYDKRDRTKPLHHPENLHYAAARVLVVKKNKSVLENLVKDLKHVGGAGLLTELPVLIIDDESDQASVNTIDPKKQQGGDTRRTAINGLISKLIALMPRAQYIGYTATPFANVFIDPSDSADLFPNDFLISLDRPEGYMGVSDFHDLDMSYAGVPRTFVNSCQAAHVRGVLAEHDDGTASGGRLAEALDAFLLSGAIKLYRVSQDADRWSKPFRHHTMLVHESVRMREHEDLARRISGLWHAAAPLSPASQERLRTLWEKDFGPVSADRAEVGVPLPRSFDDLRPYLMRAHRLISKGNGPVIVVNGDKESDYAKEELDFDRTPNVWKVLVGGTKLSRGFTVEGLTVSYYRRTSKQAATLMQMGRWFGFRPGYRDLVRLYIGREETTGSSSTAPTYDLYEAFEAICRDEEEFRRQLGRYATMVDDRPQVTPAQIPPLVSQHLSWLRPEARNKMFNARLVEVRSPGQWVEPVAYPSGAAELAHNGHAWLPVLESLDAGPADLAVPSGDSYRALVGTVNHAELLRVLEQLSWVDRERFEPHLESLRHSGTVGEPIEDWAVVLPQHASGTGATASLLGTGPLSVYRRTRRRGDLFGAISDPKHRMAALRIAGASETAGNDAVESLVGTNRGAVVLYPVVEREPILAADGSIAPEDVVVAFALVASASSVRKGKRLVRFTTYDSGGGAIVDRKGRT